MTRLGITGGIGSGKSYVSRILQAQFGIPVYDCDARAKSLMQSDEEVRQALTQLVGPEAYDGAGNLNRAAMARYVFASPSHAERVNGIVHPAVRRDFRRWTEQQQTSVVALESAILYESAFDSEVDEVLYVDAPLEVRIQRAMQRDGATRQQVEARIACQSTDLARTRATYVINNDGAQDVAQQLGMFL